MQEITFKKVYIAEDPMNLQNFKSEECIDVRDFIMGYFPSWPETARLYHKNVSKQNDITPETPKDIEQLGELEGPFYIVVYPAASAVISFIISTALSYIASALFAPKPKSPSSQKNRQVTSPNNGLSDRSNQARINARIPDIYGQVRSIPDLISAPYKIYKSGRQVELAYMCIGRGYYDVDDVKEASTLIENISNSTVEIWEPNTSPNSLVGSPQLRIGNPIIEPLVKATEVKSVNGQTLRAPNANSVKGDSSDPDIKFLFPDGISIDAGSNIDFTDYFAASDSLTVAGASVNSLTLDGTYTISSVSANLITLSSPELVNSDWTAIDALPGDQTDFCAPTLSTDSAKWIGPFFVNVTDLTQVFANFVCLNGLYTDNGTRQNKLTIQVLIELTPVDHNGDPIDSPEEFTGTIEGSATLKDSIGITIKAEPTFTGRCQVRAKRVTDTNLSYKGSVVDEVKWEALYGISPVTEQNFGDVTTVYSQTYATPGALAIRERQLNMLVTRKIPLRISGSTFSGTLTATSSADEIISAICLDPYLGNRSVDEIDFDSIYNTIQAVKDYFGNDVAGTFNYTFDDDNTSFEEMISTIAETVFCKAYRQGNKIKLSFEKATEDSSLIFNHRNKIPDSETRTVSFGNQNNNDGVQLEYIDPDDDTPVTYYIPIDQSAVNPIKIEADGVRSHEQAYWLAWRAWNKIKYQNIASEFTALSEAAILTLNERVLVANNTQSQTQDGEVVAQTGLTLTLSQPVKFEVGKDYVIFLQLYDGTVESIDITEGPTNREVVLASPPSLDLVLDKGMYVRTSYIIVADDETLTQAFLIDEKDPKDDGITFNITAKNYSSLYYQQDNLVLWLPFFETLYEDVSPYGVSLTENNTAEIITDAERGESHQGYTATDYVTIDSISPPASYTKTCWIKKTGSGTSGNILSSESSSGDPEAFYITSGGNLAAWHDSSATGVSSPWPAYGEWHHAAVSYDEDSTTMRLYIDGEMVDEDSTIAQRTIGNLTAFGYNGGNALIGLGQDLRLYNRVLSPQEIKEIYRASLT